MGGLFSCDCVEGPAADGQTPTPSRVSTAIASNPPYYHPSVHLPTPQPVARIPPSAASHVPYMHTETRPQPVARIPPSAASHVPYKHTETRPQPVARIPPSAASHVLPYTHTKTPSCPRVLLTALSRLPLAPAVYEESTACEWDVSSLPHGESFRLVNVSAHEDDFLTVADAFYDGAKGKNFKITKVERVENPFLLGCYLLKKEEMTKRYGFVKEEVHFHGTKKCNIKQICENNFNWRLHGGSTGNRYGKGVSFSPISYYASHYSDKSDTDKVMFYVCVLVSNSVIGNGNMVLPPKLHQSSNSRYDTAEKENNSVTVKFSDNEFYPEFIIHYKTPAVQPNHRYQPRRVNHTPQPTLHFR